MAMCFAECKVRARLRNAINKSLTTLVLPFFFHAKTADCTRLENDQPAETGICYISAASALTFHRESGPSKCEN